MNYLHWDIDTPFELEDMLNETLSGLQDLDVPQYSGPVPGGQRKISGTAIFGVTAPSQVADLYKHQSAAMVGGDDLLDFDLDDDKGFFSSPIKKEGWDEGYYGDFKKAPPSSPGMPQRALHSSPGAKSASASFTTNYSVRYLQQLNNREATSYVDDIEPLLDKKYVPLPVQEPKPINLEFSDNAFLPPPCPVTTDSSPVWSSPEPTSPSPSRSVFSSHLASSPVHPELKHETPFYNSEFFSEPDTVVPPNDVMFSTPQKATFSQMEQMSFPQSSPIKYTSPSRLPVRPHGADDTMDANATIPQITPLKASALPNTPVKQSPVRLEWSPIISPNPKANQNVRKHIQQSTPKRIKKTSLLPPGELDRYWVGPDESKTYTCTYRDCGKKFTRRYNVRSHIQTHLCDRPFACSYCPKKFVRQHDLNRHVKGHLEARHCKCPCGKEFARLDALKKHRERNICVGGAAPQQAAVQKPVRSRNKVLDEVTSGKVMEDLMGQ